MSVLRWLLYGYRKSPLERRGRNTIIAMLIIGLLALAKWWGW